jgi:hypothetical protein
MSASCGGAGSVPMTFPGNANQPRNAVAKSAPVAASLQRSLMVIPPSADNDWKKVSATIVVP